MVIIGLCLDGPRSNVFRIGRRPRVLPIFAASRAPRCQSPFGTIRDRPASRDRVHETVRCGGKKESKFVRVRPQDTHNAHLHIF